MEAVISNPKPFILIGSDEGAQRIGIDANMNLEIKGRAVPLDVLWELGDFLPGTTIEIPVIGLFFFQYTNQNKEVYFYFSQYRGKEGNNPNTIMTHGVQLSRDKMIAYKHILKLAGYRFAR